MTSRPRRRGPAVRRYDFVMPSAVDGIGSLIDIGATAELSNYRLHPSANESDEAGLRSDWQVIGRHFRSAMRSEKARSARWRNNG